MLLEMMSWICRLSVQGSEAVFVGSRVRVRELRADLHLAFDPYALVRLQ